MLSGVVVRQEGGGGPVGGRGELGQDPGQIRLGIDAEEPAGPNDRVDHRRAPAGFGIADEEPVAGTLWSGGWSLGLAPKVPRNCIFRIARSLTRLAGDPMLCQSTCRAQQITRLNMAAPLRKSTRGTSDTEGRSLCSPKGIRLSALTADDCREDHGCPHCARGESLGAPATEPCMFAPHAL